MRGGCACWLCAREVTFSKDRALRSSLSPGFQQRLSSSELPTLLLPLQGVTHVSRRVALMSRVAFWLSFKCVTGLVSFFSMCDTRRTILSHSRRVTKLRQVCTMLCMYLRTSHLESILRRSMKRRIRQAHGRRVPGTMVVRQQQQHVSGHLLLERFLAARVAKLCVGMADAARVPLCDGSSVEPRVRCRILCRVKKRRRSWKHHTTGVRRSTPPPSEMGNLVKHMYSF